MGEVKSCNEKVDELACHAEPVEALSQLLGQVILTAAGPAVQTEEPHNNIRDRGCLLSHLGPGHGQAGMDVGVSTLVLEVCWGWSSSDVPAPPSAPYPALRAGPPGSHLHHKHAVRTSTALQPDISSDRMNVWTA